MNKLFNLNVCLGLWVFSQIEFICILGHAFRLTSLSCQNPLPAVFRARPPAFATHKSTLLSFLHNQPTFQVLYKNETLRYRCTSYTSLQLFPMCRFHVRWMIVSNVTILINCLPLSLQRHGEIIWLAWLDQEVLSHCVCLCVRVCARNENDDSAEWLGKLSANWYVKSS